LSKCSVLDVRYLKDVGLGCNLPPLSRPSHLLSLFLNLFFPNCHQLHLRVLFRLESRLLLTHRRSYLPPSLFLVPIGYLILLDFGTWFHPVPKILRSVSVPVCHVREIPTLANPYCLVFLIPELIFSLGFHTHLDFSPTPYASVNLGPPNSSHSPGF